MLSERHSIHGLRNDFTAEGKARANYIKIATQLHYTKYIRCTLHVYRPRYITYTAEMSLQKSLTQKQQKMCYEYILYFISKRI